jgi:hypothetical protein
MPSIADFTLADSVPANHVYSIETTDGRAASFNERISTIGPAAWPRLSIAVSNPTASKGKLSTPKPYTYNVKLDIPITQTVGGVTTVARHSSASVNFYFAPDSTETERKDVLALLTSLFGMTTFKASVAAIQPYY